MPEWQSAIRRKTPVFAAVQHDVYDAHVKRVQTRSRINLHSTAGSAIEVLDWLLNDISSSNVASFTHVNELKPWLRAHLSVTPARERTVGETTRGPSSAEVDKPLRVFLCHAAADKPRVRALYRYLLSFGVQPWFDEANLLPGQDWELEIAKAIRESHAVIVCLSAASVAKTGFVQREIKFALDVADEQPERSVFIIPLKLDECEVPARLSRWHWVTAWDRTGIDKLMQALAHRARALKRQVPEPAA